MAYQQIRSRQVCIADRKHLRSRGSNTSTRSVLGQSYQLCPHTRFGTKYYDRVHSDANIDLYLNLNLVDINLKTELDSVDSFVTRTYKSNTEHQIRAKNFALCCGALENARVLLLSDKQIKHGIGNHNDQVGRYFCEHVEVPIGRAILRKKPSKDLFYLIKDEFMLSHKCLSFVLGISPSKMIDVSFTERLSNFVRGNLSHEDESIINIILQQSCESSDQVSLTQKKDSIALRKIALHWQESELDKHTLRTAAIEIATSLAKSDVGRMQVYDHIMDGSMARPPDYIAGMNHPMCTTRMSDSPVTGVVDKNCKVFGMDNLFIIRSSVFSSAGISNPTYTIVQLALRLSAHIHQRLRATA